MLDTDTRRRIDTARDILVGKLPDPKSQVEQITIALIYKFMYDMDQESIDMGGSPSFFIGEYQKFAWNLLVSPRMGAQEALNLYAEALTRLYQNPALPQFFRDVFKNAFLPYRDPETLKLFLKTIDEFKYEHTEQLGDAFEYLLSVLSSQGDAGQFRTPRHIIDFIVRVVAPQKGQTVLDPACGTAGFLVSAYKYIRSCNPGGMTTAEMKRLAEDITGYDISPDMVRLSLVNLFLHGFNTPKIYEYDTLTSQERWNDYFDIVLANPPFMSPKGGIIPHDRFKNKSKRSELLFVDYIAEHLTPSGRGAVIVPEGIIFQSATAYKNLRKYLVENNFLWAVVSLPAGVFNPYSGVKTSILFFDKVLARKTDQILFVKVAADGYDLGAQRRENGKNDLPAAEAALRSWRQTIYSSNMNSFLTEENDLLIMQVSSKQLAENGEYNLSADRYRKNPIDNSHTYPLVKIGDICTFEYGKALKEENRVKGDYPVFGSNGIVGYHNTYLVEAPFIVIGRKGSAGEVHYSKKNGTPIDTTFFIKLENEDHVILMYLFHTLKSLDLGKINTQAGVPGLNRNDAYQVKIPLPPLDVQRQIVAEIAACQRIIAGARQVVENWKPNLDFEIDELKHKANESWQTVKLGDVCKFVRGPFGGSLKKEIFVKDGYLVYEQYHAINNDFSFGRYFIDENKFREMIRFEVLTGDLIVSCSGTMGKVAIIPPDHKVGIINQALLKLTPFSNRIDTYYLKYMLDTSAIQEKYFKNQMGVAIQNVSSVVTLKTMELLLPPLDIQHQIVARLETERAIVASNRTLIQIYEDKIRRIIARVWQS